MLFSYPIEATHENWLHESLVSIIQVIHSRLDDGEETLENQQAWRNLIPAFLNEEQSEKLARSTGTRDRVFTYINTVAPLSVLERQTVFSSLENQNQVANLLAGNTEIESIETEFPEVQVAVSSLFVFCYGKLTDFEVRGRQYRVIFDSLDTNICPFCGIERMLNPDETAQDQDHYLAKSIYPFAAVNMRNLVPMCRCCNRDYKKTIDVLRDVAGTRRRVFDPYNCVPPRISLLNSVIEPEISPPLPNWNIQFLPESEETETWDSVFSIRSRYKRDVLDQHFDKWLGGFRSKCANDRKRRVILENFSQDQVRNVLSNYHEDKSVSPPIGMAGFLELLVFEFILRLYDEGDNRIIQLVRDAVLGTELEVAA